MKTYIGEVKNTTSIKIVENGGIYNFTLITPNSVALTDTEIDLIKKADVKIMYKDTDEFQIVSEDMVYELNSKYIEVLELVDTKNKMGEPK